LPTTTNQALLNQANKDTKERAVTVNLPKGDGVSKRESTMLTVAMADKKASDILRKSLHQNPEYRSSI